MHLLNQKAPITAARVVSCAARLAVLLLMSAVCAAVPLLAGGRAAMSSDELRRLFEAGDYQQVQTASQAAVEEAPQDPAVHYWLARSSYELGSYDTAVRAAEDACRLNPQNSEFQMWLGRAYGRKAEIESSFFLARKTKRALETAVRLDGRNIAARRNLVAYYTDAPWFLGGSREKARLQVDAIAELDPLEGLLAMADYYSGIELPQEARKQYEMLLEKHPQRVHFYLEALDFYRQEHDSLSMVRVLDAAHSVAPQDPRLLFYRAVSRVIGGLQLDQAEVELKQFVAVYPGNSDSVSQAEGREWLGVVYEREGKWQAALEQYRQAAQFEPYKKRYRKAAERAEKEVKKQAR